MNYPTSLIIRLITPFIISYSLLGKIIYPATIFSSSIILNLIGIKSFIFSPYLITLNNNIRFSEACAIISAYFLLLLLVVLTKDISFKKRLKIFLIGSIVLFIINIIRILVLIYILETRGFDSFQQTHDIIWLVLGSILVSLTWIGLIRHYKIKSIPIYSDIKYLL